MKKLEKVLIISFAIIFNVLIMQQDVFGEDLAGNLFPASIGMKGMVSTSNVNVRTSPDLSASVLGLKSNTDVMVIGKYEEWYRIEDGRSQGWISSQYVSVQNSGYIPEVTMLGEQIVEYGKKFIGTPYVWGGSNLSRGVDCSGFTQEIYKNFDININRISNMQALSGRPVSKNDLKTGDLIFFDTNGINKGRISHVGVYAGDGEFIHSSSSRGISIAKLDNSYYKKNYVKSVRLPGI